MKNEEVAKKLFTEKIKVFTIEECYKHYITTSDEDIKDKIETRVFHLIKRFDLKQCVKYHNSFGDLLRQKISVRIKEIGQRTKIKPLPKKCLKDKKGVRGVIIPKEDEEE